MGAWRTNRAIAIAIVALLVSAPSAFAHGGENHDAPPAAGTGAGGGAAATGGGAAPGTIPTVNEPVTGGGGGTPAPGAQPAAPSGLPPVVAGAGTTGNVGTGATNNTANTANTANTSKAGTSGAGTSGNASSSNSSSGGAASTSMIESISEPVTTTVPKTASGGGANEDITDNGASAVPDDAPVVSGAGDLPFTGIEETVLLISLAGMLVPIGVLLYSFARHGEVRWLRRHLAEPRFQWSVAPGVRPDANRWPDARA